MSCDRYRDAISARADGEDPGLTDVEIDAHLSECTSCRQFSDSTHQLRRRLGVYDATTVPDVTRRVVATSARDDRRRTSAVVRWLLGLVAMGIIILAIPDFLSTDGEAHSLRHLGAFSVAYGVGLLVVVARPARARTMLNVAVVLVAALAATAAVDVVRGHVTLLNETVHLLELGSAAFLWVLTRPLPEPPPTVEGTASSSTAGLRSVPDDT
jgi:predicted anti-sigma-YlaC factor YlaD